MKIRALSIALLLSVSGLASAAPTLQSCQPMEVTHDGPSGLSYSLTCTAGTWQMNYKGSIPAGKGAETLQYRLAVTGSDGTNLQVSRSAYLADPSLLGQLLAREAVQLENGSLALRNCPDLGCTLYAPLGGDGKLTKASITVTPEVMRLRDERTSRSKTLAEDLEASRTLLNFAQQRQAELEAQLEKHRADLQNPTPAKEGAVTEPSTDQRPVSDNSTGKLQADLSKVQEHVRALSGALSATEAALLESDAELAKMTAQRNDIAKKAKDLSETTLSLIDEVDAMKDQVQQALSSKSAAEKDAAEMFTKLEAAKLTQELSTQAAKVAHMEVDSLNIQLSGVTAELKKALEQLSAAKSDQKAKDAIIQRLQRQSEGPRSAKD